MTQRNRWTSLGLLAVTSVKIWNRSIILPVLRHVHNTIQQTVTKQEAANHFL